MIRIRFLTRAAAPLGLSALFFAAPAGAATPSAPGADTITPPAVSDPMLAPPPPAPRTVASWDEALALIRMQSPDYRSSAEAVRRVMAQKEVALAAILPTLQAQGGYTHEFLAPLQATLAGLVNGATVPFAVVTPPQDAIVLSGTAAWNLVNPPAMYRVGTADRAIEAEELAFEDRRRQIATSVVDAMLATLAAARVADLNRVGLRAALERLALTQARLEYGQGTELDVDRAQQDVAASRSAVITGDESLTRAREALGQALGSGVPMAPPEGADLTSFETAVARTCRLNDDIEKRPDVLAAKKRLEIAERGVHDAELMFAPSLGVFSAVQYANEPVIAPKTTWSISALVSVPIYDGGARFGVLHDSGAALEQARDELAAQRLAAIVASARAGRAVGVLEHTRDVARQQRDLALRVDARTRDGYSRGLGTSLDLVVSAQALRQAEIDLAILEFQVDDARANAVLVDAECAY
ncbi:MAG TPA: TolC family protein [Polyangiaceae bacterium]|nr:TolC family protein [Polyangiaceae bacterium]